MTVHLKEWQKLQLDAESIPLCTIKNTTADFGRRWTEKPPIFRLAKDSRDVRVQYLFALCAAARGKLTKSEDIDAEWLFWFHDELAKCLGLGFIEALIHPKVYVSMRLCI
jgi:hypothetical protein